MNRKKESYDRIAVGERIRQKRTMIGLSQDELAEQIDRAPKYISDIERGICGMSIETMLAFSKTLDMPLDYMMFGTASEAELSMQTSEEASILHIISTCSPTQREYALRLLKLFIASMNAN